MRTYQTPATQFASMSFLRRTLVTGRRRMRILLRMRRSRGGPSLVPRTVLLLLFPLLLSVPLLHRRHRLGQRMGPLLRQLQTPVRGLICGLRLRAPLGLRRALRLPYTRLRLGRDACAAGLAKRTETIVSLRLLPRHRSRLYWPAWCFLPHQRLVQVSTRLCLPLSKRTRHGSRCP